MVSDGLKIHKVKVNIVKVRNKHKFIGGLLEQSKRTNPRKVLHGICASVELVRRGSPGCDAGASEKGVPHPNSQGMFASGISCR